MRIVRFKDKTKAVRYGIMEGDVVTAAEGDPLQGLKPGSSSVALHEVKLLAPIQPPNVLCLGENYKAHVEEGGGKLPKAPILFMKATTAVIGSDEPVVIPKMASANVDYEAELALVIGKTARHVSESRALEYVLGYTCAHDVSARDAQRNDGQWVRGKSFETFCPLGPVLVTADEIPNPNTLAIKTSVNDATLQDWNTEDMIFDVPDLIAFLSGSSTLEPGTVIMTGTPHGVGAARTPPVFLAEGDTVTVEIAGIGSLTNPVVAEH